MVLHRLAARPAGPCAIAVLVALLRGAEGRVRSRILCALAIAGVAAVILLGLAAADGFTHAVTA